ncbi:arylamine N-acetyltransferase family protein [Paenibacillus oceani]|uniref:Arylamine N-acetyltransferase n=1 Tax=Paenibacillus oceani TaxID=2772510 RepID=A0A927C8T1_9BACL|nr:arylamine N-acetyltransferase [Paenibacillus oceani]MBD2861460.1 arylamine N-acetyltransferase [Paenibacillus oceani]
MHESCGVIKLEIRTYLDRLGYSGPLDGSAKALADLQECHLYAVPYENLDILRRIPISLEVEKLYDKIVVRRRGGYCFELNALFGWLLRELGYTVTDYFSRFWRDEPNLPPKRRHHVLRVEAEEDSFLCDVGVGGIVPRRPLQMVAHTEQRQAPELYRLERHDVFGWVLCEWKRSKWNWIYSFSEEPQLPHDYAMANYWCEHAPDSIFTKGAMAAIRTKEGRKTLAGNEFRIFTPEGVSAFTPQTKEAYALALKDCFGIVLD